MGKWWLAECFRTHFPFQHKQRELYSFQLWFLPHNILSAVENRWPACKLRSEMQCVYTWFLPSDKYTDKHVIAILINHTLGALPTVFPRTGRKMQHSKEIPHIAASDPLPKPGLRKTAISLLESHVITLPATFLNAPQLFFLHWLPTNTAHKTRVTHSILLCQTILRKGYAGVIWCRVC